MKLSEIKRLSTQGEQELILYRPSSVKGRQPVSKLKFQRGSLIILSRWIGLSQTWVWGLRKTSSSSISL